MARIGLILTPGFADWEYAFIAGTASPFYGIDVRFFATITGQFKSQGGLAVTVDSSLQHCLDWTPDVVVVIGGMAWERSDAPDNSRLSSYQSLKWRNNFRYLLGNVGTSEGWPSRHRSSYLEQCRFFATECRGLSRGYPL